MAKYRRLQRQGIPTFGGRSRSATAQVAQQSIGDMFFNEGGLMPWEVKKRQTQKREQLEFETGVETQAEEQVLTHKYRLQQEGLQTEQARQATIATGGQTPHEGLAAYNSLVQGIQDQRLIFRGETPGVTQSPARRDYNALVEGMRQLETIYHDQQFGDEPPDFQGPNAAMSAEETQKAL